jgi:exodeoxyribonuclease VII large subunit
MAHTNTNAPTKAAEFIVAHNRAFEENLNQIKKSLIIKIQQVLAYSQNKIFSFNSSILNKARNILTEKKDKLNKTKQIVINNSKNILFQNHKYLLNSTTQITAKPITTVSKKQNDLKNIANNLKSFSKINISNQQGYLNHFLSVFRIMSPKNILKKGFAIVKQNGKILKNGEQIEVGTELNITLAETELKTKVISKNKINEREYEL